MVKYQDRGYRGSEELGCTAGIFCPVFILAACVNSPVNIERALLMHIKKNLKLNTMKLYFTVFLLILIPCIFSCTGPRNIYSASPFVSPVRMEKGATAVEVNYFTHTRQTNVRDSVPGNRDNCFGLVFSHMPKERTLVFAYTDVKKERNQFHDSTAIANDPSYNAYNAGFDSSVLAGKRYSLGAGIEFFSKDHGKATMSLAVFVGFHQLKMNESGLLMRTPYHRFYKVNQMSLSLQQNFLFKISNSFKLAWVTRLTMLNSFKATTDYSSDEKRNAGLHDKRINVFFCLTGLYADCRPLKNVPMYINGQFFNDLSMWNRSFTNYELGRIYIKRTGVPVGMKYIFK